MLNKHDARRRTQSIKAALKLQELLDDERVYLSVKDPAPMDELHKVITSLEFVEIILSRLTEVEGK